MVAPPVSAAEFEALYHQLKRQARWGPDDRRGALNNITPDHVARVAREVMTGRTVSLAAPIETWTSADNQTPCQHNMLGAANVGLAARGLDFAFDSVAVNIHGNADSHIDALCHVSYDGTLYNDVPAGTVTSAGAAELSIEIASSQGIVGRGVLLDIPRVRGVSWLEPGDHVTADDLVQAEEAHDLRVGVGDLLFVRVGHRQRRRQLGAWDAAQDRAGLHPYALEFLADRRVALLGSDGNNDTAPAATEGVAFPVHVLAINAMGIHLMDYLRFEELVLMCEREHRWSFLTVIAPLRLQAATGSLINPIAIF